MIQQKKAEWFARDWLIAMILFSGVMVLLFIISADMMITYDQSDLVDPAFITRYDKFTENTESVQSMYSSVAGKEGLSAVAGYGELVLKSSFTVVTLVFGSIGLFNEQLVNLAGDIGIPNEVWYIVAPMIIAIITVFLIFIVITALSGRNKI